MDKLREDMNQILVNRGKEVGLKVDIKLGEFFDNIWLTKDSISEWHFYAYTGNMGDFEIRRYKPFNPNEKTVGVGKGIEEFKKAVMLIN